MAKFCLETSAVVLAMVSLGLQHQIECISFLDSSQYHRYAEPVAFPATSAAHNCSLG